ncbi:MULTISPECIES: DUF1257 domain-containing protein [unclassified Leptolyngbya]|uniref:DUF1257 domain-containing protein n=1 Tax=unclassified Leptolyngbya TaxID=2650499 RepID=UPI0016871E61|nr:MULTISPECIES: DUF1257 domain-containing protein [unclassified Leptolyngbya]MBD1914057.1 DUF1257 domain-containing protein [Leptolyngbya sp. FACHB-8]MBD2152977.1 DUF1257 domain-containing protein [Leptolyngbya sp. FACHB-16]
MSHFSRIKVQIKDGEILHQVLQELGYTIECNAEVRGYRGDKTEAEYVIRRSNGYDLGFRRGDGDESYELVADFWGVGMNQQQFLNPILQKYAYQSLMAFAQTQGFNVEAEETLEDGTVRLVVGKWV